MPISQDRLSELLVPFLSPDRLHQTQLELIDRHLALLSKWNSKINLTAVRDPEEIVTRHFGECVFAARQLFPSGSEQLSAIDLGSGAGFPGVPLKIWNAKLRLTLIEANQKKATFLREVIRVLKLDAATVVAGRAESQSDKADLVTLRAVEQFERILPIAASLLGRSGRLALLIGDDQVQTARDSLTGIAWNPPIPVPLSRRRVLLIGSAE
jgi:16S rRNA (guanine527-N7)-methyltransferase